MRIREFSSRADGLAKRPREVFTLKQRLMHGSELSREVRQVKEIQPANGVKPAEKKKRRSFKDAVKFAVGGVAAAAIITAAATSAAPSVPGVPSDSDAPTVSDTQPIENLPVMPPVLEDYVDDNYVDDNIDYYSVSLPTYRETLEPGGYAVVLDISTAEKKRAYYKLFADLIYEHIRFYEDLSEKYENARIPELNLYTVYRSETEDGRVVHLSRGLYDYEVDGWMNWSIDDTLQGKVIGYSGIETIIQDKTFYSSQTDLHTQFASLMPRAFDFQLDDFPAVKAEFGGKTADEILDMITPLLDEHLFEIKEAEDGTSVSYLHYETMGTLAQFTITQGKADIIMPEYFKVVRDDELYGYKTLTVPAGGDCFLITGSDEYPADKPYVDSYDLDSLLRVNLIYYSAKYYNFNKVGADSSIGFPSTLQVLKNTTSTRGKRDDVHLTDFIYSYDLDNTQAGESTYTRHIYYDLAAVNVAEDTDIRVPQLSRLLPIEDKYYLYELGGSDIYTITNNGDHEVVVVGNLTSDTDSELGRENIKSVNYRYNDGRLGQFFNYEPLLPGESLTIFSSAVHAGDRGVATLTMPECCTVVDSSGNGYSHTGTEIDMLKGTTKED